MFVSVCVCVLYEYFVCVSKNVCTCVCGAEGERGRVCVRGAICRKKLISVCEIRKLALRSMVIRSNPARAMHNHSHIFT